MTLLYSTLGSIALFELLNTRLPCTSFDWAPLAKPPTSASVALTRQEGQAIAKVLKDALARAQGFIYKAQDKKRCNIDPYYYTVDFRVSNKV